MMLKRARMRRLQWLHTAKENYHLILVGFHSFSGMGFVRFSFGRQEQVWYDADAGWDEVPGVALQPKRN